MKSKAKRLLSLVLIFGIVFQAVGFSRKATAKEIAIETYYVGGTGASNENSGRSPEEAFATISHASAMINSQGVGSYKIIVLGTILENEPIQIGDGVSPIQVAITNTVSGSAIIMRGSELPDDFIVVENSASLTLGDELGLTSEQFVLDGESIENRKSAITVKAGANLNIHSNVTIQKNDNRNANGYGGAIYNLGTVTLDGGNIQSNASFYGGAIYNEGTLFINGGTISSNRADFGGGIYNSGNLHITGGLVDSNDVRVYGGGIYNTGNLTMEGGIISANNQAVYSLGTISLSGDASIPWDNIDNYIYLNHSINIPRPLNCIGDINLVHYYFGIGSPILKGDSEAIASSYDKFKMQQPYAIDSTGKITDQNNDQIKEEIIYYVGGENADDSNSGTDPSLALCSIEAAINKIPIEVNATIIIQDDITVKQTIYIGYEKNITIKSNGKDNKIIPKMGWALFYINDYAKLTLGEGSDDGNLIIENANILNTLIVNPDRANLIIKDGFEVYDSKMNGLVHNNGNLLIEGGSFYNIRIISDNLINNNGTMTVLGARIENNYKIDDDSPASIIKNNNKLLVNGGAIVNNQMIGLLNYGELTFTSGSIKDNTVDIHMFGNVDSIISDNAILDTIYLEKGNSKIELGSDLVHDRFLIKLDGYSLGREILKGDPAVLQANYEKFIVEDSNYIINQAGKLEYTGETSLVYYVGGKGANDDNNGTSCEAPFATLKKAVLEAGNNPVTIILQGSQYITEEIVINGNIALLSDGTARTIMRSYGYAGIMFNVNGNLTIGNSDYSGSDSSPNLIIDGGRDTSAYVDEPIVKNSGEIYMFPGVALQNNDNNSGLDNTFAAIYNNGGKIYMYGGIIQNNIARGYTIYNDDKASFNMKGGAIRNNEGSYYHAGLYAKDGSSIEMSGGSIDNNVSNEQGNAGVHINDESSFTMTGGSISYNKSRWGNSGVHINSNSSFNMTGGSIRSNSSRYEKAGVYIIDSIFDMAGGNVSSNISSNRVAGVYVSNGSFNMTSGDITDNMGGMAAGVYLEKPDNMWDDNIKDNVFVMDNGNISGNKYNSDQNALAGIVSKNFKVIINGGLIRKNLGAISGVISQHKDLEINGGEISENIADMAAGIIVGIYSDAMLDMNTFVLNGGIIKSNKAMCNGILTFERFQMSGNTIIDGGDKIIFLTSAKIALEPGVELISKIADESPNINVISYKVTREEQFIIDIPLGKQLIYSGNDYIFTMEDIAKFKLESEDYTINDEGKLGIILRDDWVTVSTTSDNIYNVDDDTVSIVVEDGLKTLIKELDYSVIYRNNASARQGEVIILGKGNYGGIVRKEIEIAQKAEPIYYPPFIPVQEEVEEPIKVSIDDGRLTVWVNQMPEDSIEEKMDEIILTIPTEDLLEHISKDDVKNANIRLKEDKKLSDSKKNISLSLKAEVLGAARDTEKNLSISIEDEKGRERYSWNFSSDELNSSNKDLKDVNLYLEVHDTEITESLDNEDIKGLLIDFSHEGVLPSQAKVRIYVGDRKDIKAGSKIHLYHINKDTGLMETLPYSSEYEVDEDGYISVDILHCSDYAIFTEELASDLISSLRNQISVTIDKLTIYADADLDTSAQIELKLPLSLEIVESLKSKTSQTAIGGVTVSYRSNNEKVATVDEEGRVIAKSKGKAIIYVTVTLYSGKTKVVLFRVDVKEPYIQIIKARDNMEIGSQFRYRAEAYGLDIKDLVWTTKRRSIVVINKNNGLASAKSKGTDYIVATINDVSSEIKVVVE